MRRTVLTCAPPDAPKAIEKTPPWIGCPVEQSPTVGQALAGVRDARSAFAFIEWFAREWLTPLQDGDGYTVEEVAAAERLPFPDYPAWWQPEVSQGYPLVRGTRRAAPGRQPELAVGTSVHHREPDPSPERTARRLADAARLTSRS